MADELTALIERLLKEERVHLGDIIGVRALLERCAANAGDAAAALTTLREENARMREALCRAFVTCVCDAPDYYVKVKFRALVEAQDFHAALVDLAALAKAEGRQP